jgi:hypothetical protein
MMQEIEIAGSIDRILADGEAAAAEAVALCRAEASDRGSLTSSRDRLHALEGFEVALKACFATLGCFLSESGANQSASIVQEAKLKVSLLIQAGVNAHATILLEEPFSRSRGSHATYPELEQIQDRIEAQADIMFHRTSAEHDSGAECAALSEDSH